jgi:hypothetical protein
MDIKVECTVKYTIEIPKNNSGKILISLNNNVSSVIYLNLN